MTDYYADFQNILTLLNKLARSSTEQVELAAEFNSMWECGDSVCATWLGQKLIELAERIDE